MINEPIKQYNSFEVDLRGYGWFDFTLCKTYELDL